MHPTIIQALGIRIKCIKVIEYVAEATKLPGIQIIGTGQTKSAALYNLLSKLIWVSIQDEYVWLNVQRLLKKSLEKQKK